MLANICTLSENSSFVLLIFLVFTFATASSYRGEPNYKTINIENPELCSSVTTKKEWLDKRGKAAMLVKQSRLNLHSVPWSKNNVCTFKVGAITHGNSLIPKLFGTFSNHETGVVAVIQELVFRKNETANECIDYVQFRLSNGQTTQKFCGILNTGFSMDHRFQDIGRYNSWGMGAAKSRKEIEVVIFISKEPLQEGETMDLEIAFTLYTDCIHDKDRNMRPCSDLHPTTCIPAKYFNDTVVNCPYLDCVDEFGCSEGDDDDDVFNYLGDLQPYYGTKVLVGSLSFLFLLFGAFVCFIWLCKKHKVLCWADEFAHPSAGVAGAQSRATEMNEGPEVNPAPTAPVPAPEEDKPPSYESLFPSR